MIRFYSSAAADIPMLDDHARELLQLAGRLPDGPRGAIAPDEIAAALTTLRTAVAAAPVPPVDEERERETGEIPVGLRQRAFPLITMLERAAARDKPVLWEVL
ncbi:MAG TPA: DUF1840 domain-containing protein [Solimonas sp.]